SVLTEQPQNVKLDRSQCQIFFIEDTLVGIAVQKQTAKINDIALRPAAVIVLRVAADLCLYSGNQLQRVKRLCDVIVRSECQSGNLVDILGLCRQHDHREIVLLPDLFQNRKSIDIRQHDVQKRQIN